MARINIFSRIVMFILLLLLPILVLYSYSSNVSVNVLQDELQDSNLNRLSFLASQIDSRTEELSMFPIILENDPFVREFLDKPSSDPFQYYSNLSRVRNKLSLQSVSSAWTNVLTLYLPWKNLAISSNVFVDYDSSLIQQEIARNWTYVEHSYGNEQVFSFVRQYRKPARAALAANTNAIIEVRFSDENIKMMLNNFEIAKGELFLYHQNFAPITSGQDDLAKVSRFLPLFKNQVLEDQGDQVVNVSGQQYLLQYVKLRTMDWYLVNVTPLQQILSPITKSRNLFYGSIVLSLVISLLAIYLLYRHVQIPIRMLIRNVQKLKRGDFTARILYKPKNEFLFVVNRFNDMAEQIQQLVERVYVEKIRSREATLKQLQSQINPHFLYNSLFFIVNSVELDDKEAAAAMAQSLGEYYRYTTHVENQLVPVRDELHMVANYLTIQNLRMERIHYAIDVPEKLLDAKIPRLLLQPIVENAVIHGMEKTNTRGAIVISGQMQDGLCQIIVEDNGIGMTQDERQALKAKLDMPMGDEMGCGLWNVHQRLIHHFGEQSGLFFESSREHGLKVILQWKPAENLDEEA